MIKLNTKTYTRWISLGWWSSFIFFLLQGVVIEFLALSATPWVGLMLFAGFTILTFASYYDKNYRFSPYSAFLKMLGKK